jgi:PilZ domain-containing protein
MSDIDLPDMEFRRHPRYVFSGSLHLVGSHGARLSVTDLSMSGVRFRCPRPIGKGGAVEMVFLAYNLTVKGMVRHESNGEGKGWQIGVEFDSPQPELLKVAVVMAGQLA